MTSHLSAQQLISKEKLIQSDYFIDILPEDFVNRPIGTFALLQTQSPDLYDLLYINLESSEKLVSKLQIIIKVNGDYEIIDKTESDELDKLLNSMNVEKMMLSIPLKILGQYCKFYKQDTISNLRKKLKELKILCDKKVIGNQERLNLPYVIQPSALRRNCLILSYYKPFEGIFYIDHIYLEYIIGIGLTYMGQIFHSFEEISQKIFTDQSYSYPPLFELEKEKDEKFPQSSSLSTLEELLKNKKYFWKKKSARDITRLLIDYKKEGSFIFYERHDRKPAIAYLKGNEVFHKEIKIPIEPIEGLTDPIPLDDDNLKHLLELKDNRLYNWKEVKKSLLEEANEAQKFQAEEKDKPHFNSSLFAMPEPADLIHLETQILNLNVGLAYCKGRREYMEDTNFAKNITFNVQGKEYHAALFGVFDGHGGAACAKYIVANIEKTFVDRLQEHNKEGINETGIFNAIKLAFVDLSKGYPGEYEGSTAVSAFIMDGTMFVANVGDSRAVLEINGEANTLSVDAKPQAEKFRQGIEQRGGQVIFSGGAFRVGSLISLARAIGDKNIAGITARPKIVKFILDKKEESRHLLLASDGLFDVCSSRQAAKAILELFQEGKSNQEIAQMIVNAAYQAGSKDNITVMIVSI